jgi:putative heme-binding domain-containing protein
MTRHVLCSLLAPTLTIQAAPPKLLDDQFVLPEGFHVYRAAEPELTGGSYDITFDGDGRILVGDGQNVRRLKDTDGDADYDEYEVIATGLGGRGPQGLIVVDDWLYAVGGDGVQMYSGYKAGGTLVHEKRLGAPFSTGGDHAAHTLLRGLDGWIYLVTGDGGGTGGRKHITEESSPVLNERAASVFRFSPDGEKWECVAAGGRNPPSLGMNYLGEFFSFDSDMEWHVDVPFYRPVRLNHWATGADLGWQGTGAYPPYYIDTIPGILEVGRGSPDWGVFYEHVQLPKRYHDAFLCCDYRWKSATSGGYDKSGRLVAFHMVRSAATWKAEMTLLAEAKRDAKDENGIAINFSLVDVDVAPDGSLFVSDHNQGVWRIFYDESDAPKIPNITRKRGSLTREALLAQPQPGSEFSRVERVGIERNPNLLPQLAQDQTATERQRLRAIRLLAPDFENLQPKFLRALARDKAAEIRGQAAWLMGIRGLAEEVPDLLRLLADDNPFVCRRAAEALSRASDPRATPYLIGRMGDQDRHVRYAAMTALAHRERDEFMAPAIKNPSVSINMRALVAAHIRGERPGEEDVQTVVGRFLDWNPSPVADQLDGLRIFGLFQDEIEEDQATRKRVLHYLLGRVPAENRNVRWEQVRLLGQYGEGRAFGPLLKILETEPDGTTQFHIAQALAGISEGWTPEESRRLAKWLASTQIGWFSELKGKGLQFDGFWATTVNQLAEKHAESLVAIMDEIIPGSRLASVALKGLSAGPELDNLVINHYRNAPSDKTRIHLLDFMAQMSREAIAKFLVEEYGAKATGPGMQNRILKALASQPLDANQIGQLFLGTVMASDDPDLIGSAVQRLQSEAKPLTDYEQAVARAKVDGRSGVQAIYFRMLELMVRLPGRGPAIEGALAVLSGQERPGGGGQPLVIWSSSQQLDKDHAYFAREFEVPDDLAAAELIITCDNHFEAYLNGKKIAASREWGSPVRAKIKGDLRDGINVIAVHGENVGGPGGLIALLKWHTKEGRLGSLGTDTTWRMTKRPSESWQTDGIRDGAQWVAPVDVSGPTANVLNALQAVEKFDSNAAWVVSQEYWQNWYRAKFGEAFVARPVETGTLLSDEALHTLIKSAEKLDLGDAARGRQVYLNTGCFACHGGLDDKAATLFGPALPGVTLRLNRQELADAIVYPSKQVAERFKGTIVQTTDGTALNGFVTERTDDFVTITDLQNNVTRLASGKVKSIEPQDTSLMPAKLLNALPEKDVRDLLTFLAAMK